MPGEGFESGGMLSSGRFDLFKANTNIQPRPTSANQIYGLPC